MNQAQELRKTAEKFQLESTEEYKLYKLILGNLNDIAELGRIEHNIKINIKKYSLGIEERVKNILESNGFGVIITDMGLDKNLNIKW